MGSPSPARGDGGLHQLGVPVAAEALHDVDAHALITPASPYVAFLLAADAPNALEQR